MSTLLIWCTTLLAVILSLGSCCDHPVSVCQASSPGDVIIGVLNSFHLKVKTRNMDIHPEQYECTDFVLRAFVQSLAIIHTIDTINNSGFLPGIRLGYLICDTCSHACKAIQGALHMIAVNNSLPIQCEPENSPLVKVIIGARYSEMSIAVARLLGVYMVPQISTTSSAAILDDKLRFPAFLRTIPSDKHQTQALAQLMAHFDWNWVGVVSGDDDYGRAALQSFLIHAEELQVCTAFQEVIHHYLSHNSTSERISEVADIIESSTAKVVLLILKVEFVKQLFEEMIRRGISRTWIASDTWSISRQLASMKGIGLVGDIFGFSFMTGHNPGFKQFLTNLTVGPGAVNKLIEEYKDLRFGCTPELLKHKECLRSKPADQCPLPVSLQFKSEDACVQPQKQNDDFLTHAVDLSIMYSQRLATWSIAYALRSLLQCNQSVCSGERNFLPWQLLQELKRINFTLDRKQFYFDENGNFANGYDLINWVERENRMHFNVVGGYSPLKGVVEVKAGSIHWGASNNTIPVSKCSESCPPGTAKKVSKIHCCYNCTKCDEGTYSNVFNLQNCLKCPNGTWSLRGWTHCQPRTEDFFRWDDPFAIGLLVFTGIGFLLLFSVSVILLVGRQTAVFKVAGGKLCFVMIAGLAVSFGAVVLFVGRPNDHICRSRQTMYGLGFTLSVSCVLVKAFRTFLAFLDDKHQQHMLNKVYKPPLIVVGGTTIQGLICLFWCVFATPKVEKHTSDQSMHILWHCIEGSNYGFGFMLGYIGLLALICFILALKGRKVPQRFNETGYIIFSMLIYLFVWVCFIPIYLTKLQLRSAVQAAAIVVSNFGIIFCHFSPKCYMILCKRKEDISRQAYMHRINMFSLASTKSVFDDIAVHSEQASSEKVVPQSERSSAVPQSERSSAVSIFSQDSAVFSICSSRLTVATLDSMNQSSDSSPFPSVRLRLRRKSI